MSAVIINCLRKTVRTVICQNVILFQENKEPENIFKKLLSSNEISLLKKYPNHKSINDEASLIDIFSPNEKLDKKYKFLNDIENAIYSLLNQQSIFSASIISSLLTNEYKDEFLLKNEQYLSFYQNEIVRITNEKIKLEKIKVFSECYLLSQVNVSLVSLDVICNAYFKNDAMKIVAQQFQFYSALFLMNKLTEYLGDSENEKFVEFIINPIEKELSAQNISTFLIPLIISLIDKKAIIYALYLYVSDLIVNLYQKVFEILNGIKTCIIEENYNELIKMTENLLLDLKNESNQHEKIQQIKDKIFKEIQCSIARIAKIIDISMAKARENICHKIDLGFIRHQIGQYYMYLKSIKKNNYTNKYHKYLYSSIAILEETSKNYMKLPDYTEIECKELKLNLNESLTNTKYLYEKAASELYTVAYLFDISDKSQCNINEDVINKIGDKSIIFASNAMAARYFNIVEMAPITDILDSYKNFFKESDGDMPTIKELMGLHSANIHICPPKDKKRYKTQSEMENVKTNEKEHKNDNENNNDKTNENDDDKKSTNEIENDSYYSADYCEEIDDIPYRSFQLGLNDEIAFYNNTHKIIIQPTLVSHKDQIGQIEIESIRKELKLGHGDWTYEAWIAFVYCFNKRMSHIGIKFDPKNDYNDAEYPVTIGEAILIIEQFYPIYRIRGFWNNEERIKRFVGKYSDYHYEILRALVRCFDDVDRIVTPIHMFQETYEERTQEKLNKIFNY